MKVAVITFPGSNCDYDLYKAAQQVGGDASFIWHRERDIEGYDAVLLPGGFSYGDYLRAGAIARMSPIMEDVVSFANAGGPVLGICNGFQILCESGLLENVSSIITQCQGSRTSLDKLPCCLQSDISRSGD